jgi:hypothetical protein
MVERQEPFDGDFGLQTRLHGQALRDEQRDAMA